VIDQLFLQLPGSLSISTTPERILLESVSGPDRLALRSKSHRNGSFQNVQESNFL